MGEKLGEVRGKWGNRENEGREIRRTYRRASSGRESWGNKERAGEINEK